MITNALELNRELRRFMDRINLAPKTVADVVALQVLKGVVTKTPVDTGVCRSSWAVGANKVPDAKPVDVNSVESAEGTISKGTAKIQGNSRKYPTFYILNNTPYVTLLENGHSKQQPAGMVGVTLNSVKEKLRIWK